MGNKMYMFKKIKAISAHGCEGLIESTFNFQTGILFLLAFREKQLLTFWGRIAMQIFQNDSVNTNVWFSNSSYVYF